MKFLGVFFSFFLLTIYYPAQAHAEDEASSDADSIDTQENIIQEEQDQLEMERQDQQFDASEEDNFNKNEDPKAYDLNDGGDLRY